MLAIERREGEFFTLDIPGFAPVKIHISQILGGSKVLIGIEADRRILVSRPDMKKRPLAETR